MDDIDPRDETHEQHVDRPIIVAVGASAGGLEAISLFLRGIPDDAKMSFVIIQHLMPDHESTLARILSQRTTLPIQQVAEDTPILPNHIYVIPPGQYLSVEDGVLKLSEPPDPVVTRLTIDYFFSSLAHDAGESAIGVVLSGIGCDGTAGLREIKHHGGLAVVQSPDQAEHGGMPRSAIDSLHVDYVLPAEEICSKLHRFISFHPKHATHERKTLAPSTQSELSRILDLMHREINHDFTRYRKNTLVRRIHRRMGLHQLHQFSEYEALLTDSSQERDALRQDLLIGVTRFFRNPDAWELLNEEVIQPLVAHRTEQPIRVWCAGCATGEEAYSIAMSLLETRPLGQRRPPFQIFATDVADDALSFARSGLYPEAIMKDVPIDRLRRFFKKEPEGYRINKELRESVVFANQNILAQPPFANLDLILCRNLLIYLEREAQDRVMSVFQFALHEGGALFLGASESLGQAADLFTPISKTHRIFRRNERKSWSAWGPDFSSDVKALPEFSARERKLRRDLHRPGSLASTVQRQLLEQLDRAVAVISQENRVLYVEGRADLYLQLGLGEFSAELPDLMTVARDGLKAKLRSALRDAWETESSVTTTARVERDGVFHQVEMQLSLLPARPKSDPAVLVSFSLIDSAEPKQIAVSESDVQTVSSDELSIDQLSQELRMTREELNSTISDLESANDDLKVTNEEAMAINEELQTSNEELETSQEELQSLNEELSTLNNQLELKVKELEETSNDLENLLACTEIPTVFLDSELRIRRYTPSCRDLFHFIAGDVGRPLADIKAYFEDSELLEDALAVLHDLQPREKQVASHGQDRRYRRRVLPYRTEDHRIQGVVITMTDITDLISTQTLLEQQLAQNQSIYASSPVGLSYVDLQLRYVRVNERLAEIDGLSVDEHSGRKIDEVLPGRLADIMSKHHRQVIETGEAIHETEIVGRTASSDQERVFQVSYVPVKTDSDEILGVNAVVQDITERKSVEVAVQNQERQYKLALHAGGLASWEWTPEQSNWDSALFDLLGLSPDTEPSPPKFFESVHPEDLPGLESAWQRATEGEEEYYHEFRIIKPDGEVRWLVGTGLFIKDDEHRVTRINGLNWDITEQKRLQAELHDRESQVRRIIDNQLGFVGMLDEHGVLLEANEVALKAGGVTRKEVVGKLFWECPWWTFSEESQQRLKDSVHRAMQGEVVRYDVEIRLAQDEKMMIDFMISPVKNEAGKVEYLIPSGVDIRERHAAEVELRESKTKLQVLFEQGHYFTGIIDLDGSLIDVNDAALVPFGLKRDNVLGIKFWETPWWRDQPDSQDKLSRAFEKACQGKSYTEQLSFTTPENTQGITEFTYTPAFAPEGHVMFVVATGGDVTERVRQEHHLKFLAETQLQLGLLDSSEEIMQLGADRLFEHLGLNRCSIATHTSDGTQARLLYEALEDGLVSTPEQFSSREYLNADELELLVHGDLVVVEDTQTARSNDDQQQCDERGIGSFIKAPFPAQSRLKYSMTVCRPQSYQWPQSEIDLIRELTTVLFLRVERARAEEELARSRQQLTMATESARMGSFWWEPETDLADWDDQWHDAVGVSRDVEKRGETFFELLHPDDIPYVREQARRAIDHGEEYRVEFRVHSHDGKMRWIAGNGRAIKSDNGKHRLVGLNWDVTEEKNAVERIRLGEQRLRMAAQAAGFGTLHADLSTGQTTLSPEFLHVVGLPDDAPQVIPNGELPDWLHPDDRDRCVEFFDDLVRQGTDETMSINYRIIRADAEVRWLRLLAKPIFDGTGDRNTISQVIGTVVDVTEQRNFEQSLQEARVAAEAASESKSAFVANMSHEIRTPMTAILGYAELMSEMVENEEALGHLKTIRRNGHFLLDIINDILDLSKIEANKLDIISERFNPAALIEDVRSVMEVRAFENDLELDVVYATEIPAEIESDPKRVRQILINLVGNAIKFTKTGGVSISVSYADHFLQIAVIDTGIGMNKLQLKRLFQPFQQGDHNVNREYGGTGLGLAISQRLAKLLGGSIAVESEEGQGSKFQVAISVGNIDDEKMVHPDISAETESEEPYAEKFELDCRILIVDDRRDVRFLSRKFLTDAGATVSEAEDGELAVAKVMEAQTSKPGFDLVILDMQMPKLDGYQTATAFRELGFTGPIIALTADAMQGDMTRCLEAGCNDYLSKPIDKNELLRKVVRHLEGHQ